MSRAYPTLSALQTAGYQNVNVNITTGPGLPANGLVNISYSQGPTGNVPQDARRAARIVWDTFGYRFGALSIVKTSGGCAGPVCVSRSGNLGAVTYSELTAAFGPRPRRLDATSAANAVSIPGWLVALGALLALAVIAAIVIVVVVLVRRGRRPAQPALAAPLGTPGQFQAGGLPPQPAWLPPGIPPEPPGMPPPAAGPPDPPPQAP